MPTFDKITEIYCIVDDLRKEFVRKFKKFRMLPEDGKKHRNRFDMNYTSSFLYNSFDLLIRNSS